MTRQHNRIDGAIFLIKSVLDEKVRRHVSETLTGEFISRSLVLNIIIIIILSTKAARCLEIFFTISTPISSPIKKEERD